MNQYTPWIDMGISELDYWKQRYLERGAEADQAIEGLWAVAGTMGRVGMSNLDKAATMHRIANEFLERLGERLPDVTVKEEP